MLGHATYSDKKAAFCENTYNFGQLYKSCIAANVHSSSQAMAAAASAARRPRSVREQVHKSAVNEPVSFHLAMILGNDYVLPSGKNSVDVLRQPFTAPLHEGSSNPSDHHAFLFGQGKTSNLTGTKMELWTKRFVSSQAASDAFDKVWQDRLLIATEKRLFIITSKGLNNDTEPKKLLKSKSWLESGESNLSGQFDFEIVDSIPMDEIVSISFESDVGDSNHTIESSSNSLIRRTAAILGRQVGSADSSTHICQDDDLHTMEQGLYRFFKPPSTEDSSCNAVAREDFCEQILRITTAPDGFNRGQAYHFLLRKQDYPCVDGNGNEPLHSRDDADALAARLTSMAARRRADSARETRFLRMQLLLRRGWDSLPFNLIVLCLIASNFAFTVLQLEDKEPSRQLFYEQVDLAYTVIFAIGSAPRPSPRTLDAVCPCSTRSTDPPVSTKSTIRLGPTPPVSFRLSVSILKRRCPSPVSFSVGLPPFRRKAQYPQKHAIFRAPFPPLSSVSDPTPSR